MKMKTVNFNYAEFEPIKNIALTFPGTKESTSCENTPSIKVRGKQICQLHDSGMFTPIRLDFKLRDKYLNNHPEIFQMNHHRQDVNRKLSV